MANGDIPPWLLWPGYYQQQAAPAGYFGTWNTAPVTGWSCPRCGACWNPSVLTCGNCAAGPTAPLPAKPAAPPESAIAPAPVLHPCPKPLEGGLCGCDEGGEQ